MIRDERQCNFDADGDLRHGERICSVLAFDGNEAGYEGMRKAVAVLSQRTCVRRVILPEGQEPDTLSDDELISWYGLAEP